LHGGPIGRNMSARPGKGLKGVGMTRMVDVKELPDLIGKEVGVSDWVKVDQDRIDRFADLCGDHQWIHVDVERANREIGGTIAHGFLTMSLMSTMSAQIMRVKDVKRGLNYGFNKLRFTGVVPAGSEIRMRMKIAAVEPKAGGLAITRACTVEVKGQDKPVLIAEWVGVVYM
jgi:acyl dehydratase